MAFNGAFGFLGRRAPPASSSIETTVISCKHRPVLKSDPHPVSQPTRCQPVASAHSVGHVPGPRRGAFAIFQSGNAALFKSVVRVNFSTSSVGQPVPQLHCSHSFIRSTLNMNIFRLTGDLSHLAAIVILLLKIWKTRSCAGGLCMVVF